MSDSVELLMKIQQDIASLTNRMGQMEDDTGAVVLIQSRLLTSMNELQTSVVKVREALLKVKERLG